MIIREETDAFLTGALADKKAELERNAQGMAEQSPALFSEVIPSAFRINNDVVSMLVSNSIKHVSDDYDLNFYPADHLGEYEGTDAEFSLLQAKNAAHMDAIKQDYERETADREILANSGWEITANMAAGILSPTVFLPAGAIIKGAKGANMIRSAGNTAAMGGLAMGISETALQASQQTRTMEESTFAVASGAVLGGILGAGVAKLSRSQFDDLAKKLDGDLAKMQKPQDAGAAAAPTFTREELGIMGAGAAGLSRATRVINPFNRLMNSPFKSAVETFQRMAEIPLKIEANADGRTLGLAAETEIKLYEKGMADAYVSIQDGYKALKKREKAAGLRPTDFKEFRERISYAMRNGDVDELGSEEVTRAARSIRSGVFDRLKKEAIELGMLPEDIEAKFADTYLTRMWHKDKLVMNSTEARAMFRRWAERKVNIEVDRITNAMRRVQDDIAKGGKAAEAARKSLTKMEQELNSFRNATNDGFDEYIEDVVEEVYRKLTGVGDNEVPDFIAPITRGPLKAKLLDIMDNEAAPFLENDIGTIVNSYTRQMGSEVALTRQFGRADLKDQFKALDDEYSEMVKGAGDNETLKKSLKKEYEANKKDLQDMRDLLRGTYRRSKDPDGIWAQAATVTKDVQYMSKMGGVTISSLPDMFRVAMVNGFENAFGDLLGRLKLPKELKKMQADDLREAGLLYEAVLSSRLSTLADVSDPYARGTALTRFTGQMASGFSKLTMINAWNDMMKQWAASVTQNKALRLAGDMASGKIGAKDRTYMAYLGIDADVAKVIQQQFAKHGRKEGGIFISGIRNWDNTREVEHAARIFNGALRKEADTAIVSRGASEVPSFANSTFGGLAIQFRSFTFSAHQRVLMRGLQDADANTAASVVMMVAGGMMVAAIKKAERDVSIGLRGGKKEEDLEDWSSSKWLVEGIDRSGVFSLLWEANNIYEKAGGYGITQMIGQPPASRFASRNIAGAFLGPTMGTVADMGSVVGLLSSPATGRDVTKADVRAVRNLIPFQNLVGLRHLFDAIEGGASEALDAK
jgi:hypothetical protein